MKKRDDLKDVTFLIPIRLDSIIRLENLMMVTEYLLFHFETQIHVLEASSYNNTLLTGLLHKDITITHQEDFDSIFHRTHYINMLVKECSTPLMGIWDADVIIPKNQVVEAVNFLRNSQADFVFPYKDRFLEVSSIVRELYFSTRDINVFRVHEGKMRKLYEPNPVGGAFFVERMAYINAGMENERFYGWGIEDGERLARWMVLEYIHKYVDGPLYHLTHGRGKNSQFHAPDQYVLKQRELHQISSMSKSHLEKEIKSWHL